MLVTFLIFFILNLKAEEVRLPIGLQSKSKTIQISLPEATLGEILFHDKNLSSDKTISCASCHNPQTGFTINKQFAFGVNNRLGHLNPPVIFNRYEDGIQFWNGRASSLFIQAQGPLYDPNEMGNKPGDIEKFLMTGDKYVSHFKKVYGTEPTIENMIKAIVEYQKTILIGHSRYDLYKAGKINAINNSEKRGMNLFFNKYKCSSCHSGDNFTNEKLEVRCYPKFFAELSEEEVSKLKRIKVPTLRNSEITHPYLHDGNLKSLDEVIEFYNDTGLFDPDSKKIINTIQIPKGDVKDLVKFLKTLTETKYKK